jgi:hypothetical protein
MGNPSCSTQSSTCLRLPRRSLSWPFVLPPLLLSNDMRISCGRSCRCPHKRSFRSALNEHCARAESGAYSGPSAASAG